MNRELKLWAPTSGPEESPSKSGAGTWRCIQTLEFQSSDAPDSKFENDIFNQLVVAPRASLILLANAKKNAIYAVHVEFGHNPAAARMNYLAEFSVTMPILSLTVTEETVTEAGEGKVQIYCVQTQAIQQYGLDVSQCLPPVDETVSESLGTPERSAAQDSGRPDVGVPDLIDMGPGPKSGASTRASTVSNVNVPARIPAVSSAFGSPVEVGRMEVPPAHHVEKSIAMDFAALLQAPVKMQNSAELLASKSEVISPAGNTKPPTSRSRSPTRTPDAHHGSKKGEDIHEVIPESSSLMPPLNVSNLDRAHSSSSSTSAEELPDRQQEKDVAADSGSAKPSNLAQQGGHLHLITPSELMNLAAGSKHSVAYSAASLSGSGQEQSTKHAKVPAFKAMGNTDGFTDSTVVLEKEVVETESLAVEDDITGKEVLVSSLLESLEATQIGNDYVDKEPSVPQEINAATSGYVSDRYVGGNTQIEEGEVSEDKDRPLIGTDEVNDKLRDLSFRDASGDLPLPPPQAAISKGRKNKNKTNVGGIGSGSALPASQPPNTSTSGSKPDGETSHAVNPSSMSMPISAPTPAPAPIDPAFLAQVASMQESLNQVSTLLIVDKGVFHLGYPA